MENKPSIYNSKPLDLKLTAETAARDILGFFKIFTPQFFIGKKENEMRYILRSIEVAIDGIQICVLERMFQLAIKKYKVENSYSTVNFNIHYVLKFYPRAFNLINFTEPTGYYSVIDCYFDEDEQIETTVYQLYDDNDQPTEQITSRKVLDHNPLQEERRKLLEQGSVHFKRERNIFEIRKQESRRKSDWDIN